MILLLLCTLISSGFASVSYQDLGGTDWSASGNQPPSNVFIDISHARVPGCVHLDWMNGKNLSQSLYYRFNDDSLKWIAKSNWKYTRNFKPDEMILNTYEQWLILEGIDTIATISLNGIKLGNTSDMFRTYRYNISSLLQPNFNVLQVAFQSALSYVNQASLTEPYRIPPTCPPDVQHGFCHVNLIRKEQCSFSWDWGPAFATQGIWKPVYLMSLNYAVITETTAAFDWSSMSLEVEVQFLLVMFAEDLPLYGNVSVSIEELNVVKHFVNVELPRSKNELTDKKFFISLKDVKFEKWWPNGHGSQKLYNISVGFASSRGFDESKKSFLFGFRKVELIQEKLSGSDGLSFYFKINDQPIFAKGANWIPADAFKARIKADTYKELLQSAADANMNMLRVWGGGIYEDPLFYETADRLGVMLWQDFMFACALYPSDSNFLSNVTMEIENVLWKLKHHPSIVVWAGNNENEAALSTNWYNTTENFDRYKRDYIDLYISTIGKQVKELDSSRPFVSSSPSNGKETEAEGGLAKNPYDARYGDVHYYNYNDDCLDWTKYPATRFASEYGFQSWPSLETLRPVTLESDWSIDSKWAEHRQHHPDGNQQIVNQISMHFNLSTANDTSRVFTDMIYLSQIMQGLCYKSQTEFYRRARNETINGAGHTMGALYWQLNDIWQAPTWSSLEYGGKWKALHYFAAKFFSPVALIAFVDDSAVKVYSASDVSDVLKGTLVLNVHTWDSFTPTGSFNQSITIHPHTSSLVYQQDSGYLLHYGGCPYKELCFISMHVDGVGSVPTNYFFPVPFKNVEHLHQPSLHIKDVTKLSENEFELTVTSSKPALFVWLEAEGIRGRFSDNAFIMDKPSLQLKFYSWTSNITSDHLRNKISIRSINDMVQIPEDPTEPSSDAAMTSTVMWLENETIQLTFAVLGMLLIVMTASQLICLVLRLNKPTPRPKRSCSPVHTLSKNGSCSSDMSSSQQAAEDEATGFLIRTKDGKGSQKKTEFRFYII